MTAGRPPVAPHESREQLARHAHVSDETRGNFSRATFLPDPRNRPAGPRRPPSRTLFRAPPLAIGGPRNPPSDHRLLPPSGPPINANRPSRGIRFYPPPVRILSASTTSSPSDVAFHRIARSMNRRKQIPICRRGDGKCIFAEICDFGEKSGPYRYLDWGISHSRPP